MPVGPDVTSVTALRVWHCSYQSLAPLAQYPNLRILTVASYPDQDLESVATLTSLEYLSLLHIPNVSDLRPLEQLPHLRTLRLATLPSWDSSGKVTVVDSLRPLAQIAGLRHLELFGVRPATKTLEELEAAPALASVRGSGYGSLVTDSPQIVTHTEPVWRSRANYIHRLAIDEPSSGGYEQVWTRTGDQRIFELCCIPFFPYGVSLGDRLAIADDGSFTVVEKSGHQTIRVVIHDAEYAHERHAEFHDLVARTGARTESFGHADAYWALDVDDREHAQRVIDALTPLSEARTLDWEWADPPLPS